MIGHYLVTLDEAAEGRVLTGRMRPGLLVRERTGERCLLGTVEDWHGTRTAEEIEVMRPRLISWYGPDWTTCSVSAAFDGLCERFGTDRIAAAIRNRILANQARRMLQNQPRVVRASL